MGVVRWSPDLLGLSAELGTANADRVEPVGEPLLAPGGGVEQCREAGPGGETAPRTAGLVGDHWRVGQRRLSQVAGVLDCGARDEDCHFCALRSKYAGV